VAGVAPVAGIGLSNGDLLINGVAVGSVAKDASAVTQGRNVATAINAITNQTGVSAEANAATGALTLTASDGRNIALTAGTATADGATSVYNATGLDVSSAGAPGAGHDTRDLVIAAAGEFVAAAPAAGDIAEGDTVTLDGVVYEFTAETQAQVTAGANPNNVAVTLVATDNATAIGTALASAINAQRAAGTTTLSADGATVAGTVTLTQDKFGTGGNQDITYAESFALGATAIVEAAVTVVGADSADGSGVTTRGTLTLSSAKNFTLGGADLAFAGLSTASAALSQLSAVDITTVAGANAAISVLDGALDQVSTIRADLGAIQNRFESTISNLSTTSENLSAARGRIVDADFAAETAALTRAQILQQAGVSIVAQANSLPQLALSLLQ
jgi:flagellin